MAEKRTNPYGASDNKRRAYRWLLSHKALYQRLWGGRGSLETPIVIFTAGIHGTAAAEIAALFKRSLQTQVFAPRDPAVFNGDSIRSDGDIRALIARSHAPVMVFPVEPASEQIATLLRHFEPARALWFYELPDCSLIREQVQLEEHIENRQSDEHMPSETRELIERLEDVAHLSDKSRAWLAWHARHAAFFDRGLDRNRSIRLVGAERLRREPDRALQAIFAFTGLDVGRNFPSLKLKRLQPAAGLADGSIDNEIKAACDGLLHRLQETEDHAADIYGIA